MRMARMSALSWIVFSFLNAAALLGGEAETSIWKPVALPSEAAQGNLRGIFFLDAKTGWIVGDKGLCLKTSNGGATWERQATGSDATLRCVRFTDASTGFIGGDGDSHAPDSKGHMVMLRALKSGSVLVTKDGGKTWKQNWAPCNFEVWCIEASSAPVLQIGVGCEEHLDGDVTRSADSGATWTEQRVFRSLADIRAVDAKRWVAVGSAVSVGFTGTINDPAYLAKDCRALFSSDAGKTWTPAKGSDGKSVLRGLLARKDLPLIAAGDQGSLLSSEDAGMNWSAIKTLETADFRAVTASTNGHVIVAVGSRGTFLISSDGGKTWKASWIGKAVQLYGVATCGDQFIAIGENGSAFICDAGKLAEAKDLPKPPPPPEIKAGEPTASQRARVRAGDYVVYSVRMKAPALNMNLDYQAKISVASVEGNEFMQVTEVIKGEPPPGTPKKSEDKCAITSISDEDFNTWEKDKSKDQKEGGATVTTTRIEDDIVEVNGKKLKCIVIQASSQLPVGSVNGKTWFSTELPLQGVVKVDTTQIMNMPNGGKATITRTQELIEFGRGK
jgi:photosystem II stability/assembly factor-like uncharacterized protein